MSDLVENPEDRFSRDTAQFSADRQFQVDNMSLVMRKPILSFQTKSDTNRAVQSQKMASERLEILHLESRGMVLSV